MRILGKENMHQTKPAQLAGTHSTIIIQKTKNNCFLSFNLFLIDLVVFCYHFQK